MGGGSEAEESGLGGESDYKHPKVPSKGDLMHDGKPERDKGIIPLAREHLCREAGPSSVFTDILSYVG